MAEQLTHREDSSEFFSNEELEKLDNLIYEFSHPDRPEGEKPPNWYELSKDQQKLLERRYGKPRFTSRTIRLTGYTSGEACADNERAMPSSFQSKNFGVWDKNLLVYALYDNAPDIVQGRKIRMIPAGMCIDIQGNILFPDYFYTPVSKERRDSMIRQINANPRHDKSIQLNREYERDMVDDDEITVTIYRQIGSRGSIGSVYEESYLGRVAMKKLNVNPIGEADPFERERKYIQIAKYVQEELTEIVRTSNFALIRETFADSTHVQRFVPKHEIPATKVDSLEDVVFGSISRKLPTEGWLVIEDPTWHYDSPGTLIIKETEDGNDTYYYVNREDGELQPYIAPKSSGRGEQNQPVPDINKPTAMVGRYPDMRAEAKKIDEKERDFS